MANLINRVKETLTQEHMQQREAEVERRIAENIDYYRLELEEAILERIDELENEWDLERTVGLNTALVSLTGTILAASVSKKWLILSAVAAGFLARFSLQGGSRPLPFFGHLRTRDEIASEKFGLLEILKKGVKPLE